MIGQAMARPTTSSIPDDPPHSCSESILAEFLAKFINSLVSSSQHFNPSKCPAYTSFSHQRRFRFGPGRGPRQRPTGSFNAGVDGYMVRPRRPFSIWIIHEVKQATRVKSNPAASTSRSVRARRMGLWIPRRAQRRDGENWIINGMTALARARQDRVLVHLGRVTTLWLDYIGNLQSPVLPTDGTNPLEPDCFLQTYEYGPFHVYDRRHLMMVGLAIVSLAVHDDRSRR
ncbi:hypothetical protein B0T14DRAFT_4310 [Immersiella caudata]|uniref:Uncharacterized protein n=1 Tax=Immersiella caudata TaxID=314043 RepID=A0AA39XCN2_9PEZI|nr:hypothetical protein B0T14DRAFT_4310 [Immersiella caudata]